MSRIFSRLATFLRDEIKRHNVILTGTNLRIPCRQVTLLNSRMKYFVIGVSGVTCGGKTTLVQLLRKSFPWSKTFYQDAYFHPDDDPRHIRLPEVQNHVNYEVPQSLDLDKMHEDFSKLLQTLDDNCDENGPCNFEADTQELLMNVKDIGFDASKYRKVPILIVEGFLILGSPVISQNCDVKLFLTLPKEECWNRRSKRTTYIPPDVPGYFEACVWPEYEKHYQECVHGKDDIIQFDGNSGIENLWEKSLKIITGEIEKKFPV